MDKSKVLNCAKEYAAAVRRTMDTEAILLYGSHAKGTATQNSDIDIAVIVNDISDDYLSAISTLWKLSRAVNPDIEPVLLTSADAESGFLRTVRETGVAV